MTRPSTNTLAALCTTFAGFIAAARMLLSAWHPGILAQFIAHVAGKL